MTSLFAENCVESSISIHRGQEILATESKEFLYALGMELKDWVKAARKSKKLTLEQLGEQIGRSKANVGHWETGKHNPSYEQLLQISDITGYPMPGNTEQANTPRGSNVSDGPTLIEALPVVLDAMAAAQARTELRQLLPMLVDTNAEAYRVRLLELLQNAASNQPQEKEARVHPAYQGLADAEVRFAEERKQNEQTKGSQPTKDRAA